MKADPTEMITIEVPEWRIVDDALWFAVNGHFTKRGPQHGRRPAAKYPLSGIAKCGTCGGAITAARVGTHNGQRSLCYSCGFHRDRGRSVCAVSVHQPMGEVEAALIEHLQQHVLSDDVLNLVLTEIRAEIAEQLPKQNADIAGLEAELAEVRAEQKRLARAVAMTDDVPELVSELKKHRSDCEPRSSGDRRKADAGGSRRPGHHNRDPRSRAPSRSTDGPR